MMNERIIHLAEQAGLSKAQYYMDQNCVKHFDRLFSLQDNHTEQVRQFVKLLVDECVDIVQNPDSVNVESALRQPGTAAVCTQIKKRFGIE